MGIGMLCFSGGLSIGLFILKSVILDAFLSNFIIILVAVFNVTGLITATYGLRKR